MDLPRVLHLFGPADIETTHADALLEAAGRTLTAVVGPVRPAPMVPLSRYLGSSSSRQLALRARVRGVRLVHAHAHADLSLAARVARSLHIPWTACLQDACWDADLARQLATASLVVVPDESQRSAALAAGIDPHLVRVHKEVEPGALLAVLESHWAAVLKTGRPAGLSEPERDLPTVTVLLATYQRRALLARCLDALQAQTYPSELIQVVVVDNGSNDGSSADLAARARAGELTVVSTGQPILVTEARNQALEAATGELVAFTDDDCRASPEWLANLVGAWLGAGRGIVQGRTSGDPAQPRAVLSRTQDTRFGYGLYETCNIGYPRAALGEQPFDSAVPEQLRAILGKRFPKDPTGEDTDLGWRLRDAGLAYCFSGTALVLHEVFEPDTGYLLRRARMSAVFPVLVRRHGELRNAFLVGKVFLHRRQPWWWIAALSLPAAAAWLPAPVVGATPYLWQVLAPHRPGRAARLRALPITLAVDGLTAVALVKGSVKTRTVVL